HLLQHPDTFITLLEKRVEVGCLPAQGRVLEDGGEVAGLALTASSHTRGHGPFLHLGSLDGVPLRALRTVHTFKLTGPLFGSTLFVLRGHGEAWEGALGKRKWRRQRQEDARG